MPITEEDMASEQYERGISCPHCFDAKAEERRQRYAERERQVQLAKQRGETHIGESMAETIERRRKEKLKAKEQQRKVNS